MRIVRQVHRLSGPLIRSGLATATNFIAANSIAANDVRGQLRLRGCRQPNYFRPECVSADSIH